MKLKTSIINGLIYWMLSPSNDLIRFLMTECYPFFFKMATYSDVIKLDWIGSWDSQSTMLTIWFFQEIELYVKSVLWSNREIFHEHGGKPNGFPIHHVMSKTRGLLIKDSSLYLRSVQDSSISLPRLSGLSDLLQQWCLRPRQRRMQRYVNQ